MLNWEFKNILTIGFVSIVFTLNITYPNPILLSVLTGIAVLINVYTFFKERKELKCAKLYVRTKYSNWWRIVFLVFYFGTFFAYLFFSKLEWDDAFDGYIIVILLSTIFSDYYDNFSNGIRVFEEYLVVPGFVSKRYAWSDIESVKLNKVHIEIETKNGKTFIYKINPEDVGEALQIQNQFVKEQKL